MILVTFLVDIAATDLSLRSQVISGATTRFPLIGKQLASTIHVLPRSTAASLTVRRLLVWGATRLAQAGLSTMEQVWNLPGPGPARLPAAARPQRGVLGLLALGVVTSTCWPGWSPTAARAGVPGARPGTRRAGQTSRCTSLASGCSP
jgi:hypothetical protein